MCSFWTDKEKKNTQWYSEAKNCGWNHPGRHFFAALLSGARLRKTAHDLTEVNSFPKNKKIRRAGIALSNLAPPVSLLVSCGKSWSFGVTTECDNTQRDSGIPGGIVAEQTKRVSSFVEKRQSSQTLQKPSVSVTCSFIRVFVYWSPVRCQNAALGTPGRAGCRTTAEVPVSMEAVRKRKARCARGLCCLKCIR